MNPLKTIITIRIPYMLACRHGWDVGKNVTHKGNKYIICDLYAHHDNTPTHRKWAIAKVQRA